MYTHKLNIYITDSNPIHFNQKRIMTDFSTNFIKPLSFIAFAVSAQVSAIYVEGENELQCLLYAIWFSSTQLLPYLIFLSYKRNSNSIRSRSQIAFIVLGWFVVYIVMGCYTLYIIPFDENIRSWVEPAVVLQVTISGLTLNHNLRVLGLIFSDDWFQRYNVSTPTQAILAFNATAICRFVEPANNDSFQWFMSRCYGFGYCWTRNLIAVSLVKIAAHLYVEYKSIINLTDHPYLYHECNAIYTALCLDFLVNRNMWINGLVFGNELEMEMGSQFPILATSPRKFWKRQSLHQREELKHCILKPMMKWCNNYALAVFVMFCVNCLLHSFFTAQAQNGKFWFLEWMQIFFILFVGVLMQIKFDSFIGKESSVKHSWVYKIFWFCILHISFALVVSIGVPKMFPCGLQSSYYFLTKWW